MASVKWERVADDLNTYRLAVPGGWLYRYSYREAVGLCFVPISPSAEALRQEQQRQSQ
jgi:hypothetical protein